ncbi:unnamed protein product [Rotaria sordida]|uniref:Uncharacterized protein n=1 Tax=Rotaria sordida TaxID=392033 RepID=A0A815HQU0_9BILA|nr:unnamed protein product [Rotaria sordida]CAF1604258.1 unnamed protein product [Rotaria sordida]
MATPILPKDNLHTDADDMDFEIFCLIWLDANTKVTDNRETEQKLRSIINRLKKFQDVKQCQQYIEERSQNERVVMVVSGRLGSEIVPSIHKLRQVISIYVYCMDKKRNEQWANKFKKVKAVVVALDELISRIQADHKIQKIVEEPFSINVFTIGSDPGKSTADVNGKFVFFQVLIDCLLRLKSNDKDINELIKHCEKAYEDNNCELSNLREFKNEYSPDKVLWCTYAEQARVFLNVSNDADNLEPVLFEIYADPKLAATKPFADISAHSKYSGKSEILFMPGTIFRLNSVKRSSDNQVWIIQMTLCSEDEHDLKHVLMYMKQQLGSGETNLRTLGKVLWKMGKFDLAEQYFTRLLKDLSPNDPLLVTLYEELGELASQTGDYNKSVKWHQKSLALKNPDESIDSVRIDQPRNYIVNNQ